MEDLPPSNRQILERAVLAGYYDWPRKISLTTLSANLSVPKATLSYRLRKAEKELMMQRTKHDLLSGPSKKSFSEIGLL